jgi:hypothetical protein
MMVVGFGQLRGTAYTQYFLGGEQRFAATLAQAGIKKMDKAMTQLFQQSHIHSIKIITVWIKTGTRKASRQGATRAIFHIVF